MNVTVLDRLNKISKIADRCYYSESTNVKAIQAEIKEIKSFLYGTSITCEDCEKVTTEPKDINGAKTVCAECYKAYVKCKGCNGDVFGSYVNHKGLCSDCVI